MNIQIVLVGSDNWLTSLKRCWRFLKVRQGRMKHNKAISIEVNLKRGVVFGALFALAMYLVGGLGVYLWRAQMPHNTITYWDILQSPVNMKAIVRKQGQMQIIQAREDLKNGQIRDAFFKYRSGIRRIPEDQQARLELAQFFIYANMNVKATELLVEGLEYGFPEDPDYLTQLLALTRHTDNNPALLKAIPVILEFPEVAEKPETQVAMKKLLLRAQIAEHDYTGVIDTAEQLNQANIGQSFSDVVLFALLKMGSYDDAQDYLNQLPQDVKQTPNMILFSGYLRLLQDDKAGAHALFHQVFRDYPNAWQMQRDAIILLFHHGDDAAAEALLDLYLVTQRSNGNALVDIAGQFSDIPNSKLVLRVLRGSQIRSAELFGMTWFLYTQALVSEGEFAKAKMEMETMQPASPDDENAKNILEAYMLIVDAATARSAGEYTTLLNFLNENRFPAEIYSEAAEAMRKVGAYDTAELVLNAGLDQYPFSRTLSDQRNTVLKQGADSDFHSKQAIASVQDSGYRNQNIKSDPLEQRLLNSGTPPTEQSIGVDTLVNDKKLQGFELTKEDVRKSEYQ